MIHINLSTIITSETELIERTYMVTPTVTGIPEKTHSGMEKEQNGLDWSLAFFFVHWACIKKVRFKCLQFGIISRKGEKQSFLIYKKRVKSIKTYQISCIFCAKPWYIYQANLLKRLNFSQNVSNMLHEVSSKSSSDIIYCTGTPFSIVYHAHFLQSICFLIKHSIKKSS